jgi:uncharacterized membrane protein YccC
MRYVFLLGGLLGFALAAGTALYMGGPDRIFFDGAVGCLIGALLFRWLWSVLLGGLRETMVARQRAAAAEVAKAKPELSSLKS